MPNVKLVTGYVPIPDHPRPPEEYGKLGEQLAQCTASTAVFYVTLQQCWMDRVLCKLGKNSLTHSVADNPAKNSMDYHIVQHQKIEMMLAAATKDPDAEVLVWVDYGIFHVPGITVAVIQDLLKAAESEKKISIPGCWRWKEMKRDGKIEINDSWPCWRFCGGVIVCHRDYIRAFDREFKEATMRRVIETKNVTWEVNDLAHMDLKRPLPIRWYKADHNETIMTGYAK